MWRFYHANTSCHAMTLTFDRLTLKACGTWLSSVLNLMEIDQLPAELFTIWQIFALITSHCDLDLWPWTFVVGRVSWGQYTYQIWARSINLRLSYWWLTTDFSFILRGCSNLSIGDLKNACSDLHQICWGHWPIITAHPVSYTHLTLPTIYSV